MMDYYLSKMEIVIIAVVIGFCLILIITNYTNSELNKTPARKGLTERAEIAIEKIAEEERKQTILMGIGHE